MYFTVYKAYLNKINFIAKHCRCEGEISYFGSHIVDSQQCFRFSRRIPGNSLTKCEPGTQEKSPPVPGEEARPCYPRCLLPMSLGFSLGWLCPGAKSCFDKCLLLNYGRGRECLDNLVTTWHWLWDITNTGDFKTLQWPSSRSGDLWGSDDKKSLVPSVNFHWTVSVGSPGVMSPISERAVEIVPLGNRQSPHRAPTLALLPWSECHFGRKWKGRKSLGIFPPYLNSKSKVINPHPRGVAEISAAIKYLKDFRVKVPIMSRLPWPA